MTPFEVLISTPISLVYTLGKAVTLGGNILKQMYLRFLIRRVIHSASSVSTVENNLIFALISSSRYKTEIRMCMYFNGIDELVHWESRDNIRGEY